MIEDISSFTEYWTNARARTTRVLDRLPESELEWSHAPGRFSFGDLLRHLAGIRALHVRRRTCWGRPSAIRATRHPSARAFPAYARTWSGATPSPSPSSAALSDADLHRKCLTPAGKPITTWKWLRSMVEHEAHHRGQLYLMASMRGVSIPPLYGLTEEQVLERSQDGTGPGPGGA